MIFSLLIIHNHDRMQVSSNTRVLHTATRVYFTSQLPYRLNRWNSFSESSDRGNYDSSGGLHMMELGLLSSQCVVCLELSWSIESVFWYTAVDFSWLKNVEMGRPWRHPSQIWDTGIEKMFDQLQRSALTVSWLWFTTHKGRSLRHKSVCKISRDIN